MAPDTKGGSNKRVDWIFCPNLISGLAIITVGRRGKKLFVCVKKQKKVGNFLEYQ
jgi:hypothetical protein